MIVIRRRNGILISCARWTHCLLRIMVLVCVVLHDWLVIRGNTWVTDWLICKLIAEVTDWVMEVVRIPQITFVEHVGLEQVYRPNSQTSCSVLGCLISTACTGYRTVSCLDSRGEIWNFVERWITAVRNWLKGGNYPWESQIFYKMPLRQDKSQLKLLGYDNKSSSSAQHMHIRQ